MFPEVIYTFISVGIVSLVSLIGIVLLIHKWKNIDEFLLILVSLSAGTLFGGAFLHLLPEAVEVRGFGIEISLLLLSGVVVFFLLEKFIHYRHCHRHDLDHGKHAIENKAHNPTALAPLNLIGDGIHNFLDGLVIAGAYFVSVPAGIATTIAVILHEVPQEIADFGVLVHSGFSKRKALWYNFLSATVAVIGAVVGLIMGLKSENFVTLILPFAAGGFVYIAGSNLIPELHKECGDVKDSAWHFIAFVGGIGLMVGLLFI
jgi:zinc and cadmium transporter